MSEDNEGTSLLQGTERLPEAVMIYRLLKSRVAEIDTLQKCLAQSGSKLIFQRLPIHMRRRTMSHNVKRLPRRLREAHKRQMIKSGLPPKNKTPSRRFRRRPKNLLADYARRQRNHMWLETHIWHAKRFHMVNRWDFRLSERPVDKAFRACYRASSQHCLIQDISYWRCLELTGPEVYLKNKLKLVTSTEIGLTMNAVAFKTGRREGTTILYDKNCYPNNAIGEIQFVWKPQFGNENRTLWIWAHPSNYNEIKTLFLKLFCLKTTNQMNKHNLQLSELNLNRFRLTGPLSHAVIKHSLHLTSTENRTSWFSRYLESNPELYREQTEFWKSLHCKSASELSPHVVLNLIVTDPRLSLPRKRTKAVPDENGDVSELPDLVTSLTVGAIWDEDIRDAVSKDIVSTAEILKRRREKLVPDDEVPLDSHCLPVMLIQQPGNRDSTDHLGYSSGWDIIIPPNWGLPFWFSFIMAGARAGGLRESTSLRFEQGQTDRFQPDTQAGKLEETRLTSIYTDHYFRLPPNKRVNYTKRGIVSPFSTPWAILIQEWNQSTVDESFHVLRDRNKLSLLQTALTRPIYKLESNVIDFGANCLVPVRLNLLGRGRAKRFSIICLAKESDFKLEPVEPDRKDGNEMERKVLRKEHQNVLKTLRRRRIRAKEKGKEPESNADLIKCYSEKMRDLWLPKAEHIRNSCAREIIGFVTNGDFCYSTGKGRCIGYITIGALKILLKQTNKSVLVRNISTQQYRLATIQVLTT